MSKQTRRLKKKKKTKQEKKSFLIVLTWATCSVNETTIFCDLFVYT